MTRKQFLSCTWREYLLRSNGYNRLRSKEFEHTRAIVHIIASAHWGKGPVPKIEQFWPLPTDNPEKEEINLKLERERLIEQINKRYGKSFKA